MKLCFLVLTAPYEPWHKLFNLCGEVTWARSLAKQHSYFVYSGFPINRRLAPLYNLALGSRLGKSLWRKKILPVPQATFIGAHSIQVEVVDAWDTMTKKFLAAASLVYQTLDFDFLVKVNTTTYVNIEQLEKSLLGYSSKNFWGGAISKGKCFTSGWATVLSRESLKNLILSISDSDDLKSGKYEDEAIGSMLLDLGESPVSMKFAEFNKNPYLDPISNESIPFFRLKSFKDRVKHDPKLFDTLHRCLKHEYK